MTKRTLESPTTPIAASAADERTFPPRAWGLPALGLLSAALILAVPPVVAQVGGTIQTPAVVPELPIEVETEVGPAGSLKLIPLWKEIRELLEEPHAVVCPPDDPATLHFDESSECLATTERRPFFNPVTGAEEDTMPPLRVFHPCFNVLTGQPLRMRPDDEIDWNQPGPLFDPDEVVPVGTDPAGVGPGINIPLALRTVIGELVVVQDDDECSGAGGCLAVSNPGGDPRIPPDGTIVAEPACNEFGLLVEDGFVVEELEQPVNETHFFKNRLMAEVLGKALFWDMQVGSDGVQACASCHFHAGADSRTRNQLNPGSLGGDLTLEVRGASTPQNTNDIDVVAADFPFHKRVDPDIVGDGFDPAVLVSDSNDIMSSMGVSRFTLFDDVPVGGAAFTPPVMGVRALRPDPGISQPDPIPVMEGNRRIEPRNTPTFHAAAFNFDNFWDGRARHDFNGGSVFGPSDPFFHVYVSCQNTAAAKVKVKGKGKSQGSGRGGPQLRPLAAPLEAELEPGPRPLCAWTKEGGNYLGVDEGEPPVPVRIRFSSLASQAVGPPLSDFEMAFLGRNWPKIGKKLLQGGVVPLANQLVATDDSRLGPWSNQGGLACVAMGEPTAPGKPGLCVSYADLIRSAFRNELWNNGNRHLDGRSVPMDNLCDPGEQIEEGLTPTCDPFDGYVLEVADRPATPSDTNEFRQIEANFALFFGLSVQAYEQLTIPDDTPWDKFNDLYPMLGNGVAQPGEQGTLHPSRIRELVTGSATGSLDVTLVEGIDEDVIFGFDIFAGGNLTAALPAGGPRNPPTAQFPLGVGSNPFLRTARCMLCHLGPEQSDHTNNVNAGLLQSGTEQEFPFPPASPEATGILRLVTGFSLAEELEENAQDGVEVENRNFAIFDDPLTPDFDEAVIGTSSAIAFQDNGIYNIGLRPTDEDILRGGDDPFGFPLALSALALKNLGGADFEPCDTETEAAFHPTGCALPNFDPALGPGGGLYEMVGDCPGCDFEHPVSGSTGYFQESINPGLQLEPADPLLPEYLAEWVNNLPAGEANPFIDELAFAPNTTTRTPVAEYGEILFGSDLHCGLFDPAAFGAGPPNFGWGPRCPNSQTGVPVNMRLGVRAADWDTSGAYLPHDPGALVAPLNGTWGTTPVPNRVARNGAAKVPQLRNVELTGPYFHTGSYLTLRQVVDFYVRGGDFPLTNQEDRDPNLVDITRQAFGFGSTIGLPMQFQDGVPDIITQYGPMPDVNPPGCGTDPPNCTPEPVTSTPEEAKAALVKFMLALTDERVAFRKAPFDQPEIFIPIDGAAPMNTGGRAQMVALSGVPCTASSTGICFERIPATGAGGQATRLPGFLEVSSTPMPGPGNDHFDR